MILTTPWRPHGATPPETHIFAIGDVHGQAGALERLLTHLDLVATPTRLDREIIFTGDLIDRGPENTRAIALAQRAAAAADRGTILPGNHELMMLHGTAFPWSDTAEIWFENGGIETISEIVPEGLDREGILRAFRERLPGGFLDEMRTAPAMLHRGGFTFVHAGLDPWRSLEQMLDDPREDLLECNGASRRSHWAWIRDQFLNWAGSWPHEGVDLVVHGHTPCTVMPFEDPADIDRLCVMPEKRARICLDVGAAARMGQVAALEIRGDMLRMHVEAPRPFLP